MVTRGLNGPVCAPEASSLSMAFQAGLGLYARSKGGAAPRVPEPIQEYLSVLVYAFAATGTGDGACVSRAVSSAVTSLPPLKFVISD